MHRRVSIGNRVGATFAKHQIHASGADQKAGGDGLFEHPLESNLGEATLGLRIPATDIAMNTRKPNLLEVPWAAVWRLAFRHPEVRAEERAAFVDGDGMAAD